MDGHYYYYYYFKFFRHDYHVSQRTDLQWAGHLNTKLKKHT